MKNKSILKFLTVLVLLLSTSIINAHSIIKGKVIDKDSEVPLIGASVMISGTSYGTVTDRFGDFTIKTDTSVTVLMVAYIGYKSQEIIANKPSEVLLIKLKSTTFNLSQVTLSVSTNNSFHQISKVDTKLKPVNSSQDVLRGVPGVVIGQHAGGGKAEQIFVRGFDCDHGTDINISVDGMPVNMVSHAHGQGYADLHFLIPEIIGNVDYGKGPYYSKYGNFTTGGYIDLSTKNTIQKSMVKLEGGNFNSKRMLGVFDLIDNSTSNKYKDAYIASEFLYSDGPFESPQHFNRINLFGKYHAYIGKNKYLTLMMSTFKSKWNASGQIPERAVEQGTITRFGSIDDTEGGFTSRSNASAKLLQQYDNGDYFTNQLYYTNYTFDLYSDFTFFLNDPVNGDQIRQTESRNIYGYKTSYNKNIELDNSTIKIKIGGDIRYDAIDNIALFHTKRREAILDTLSIGDVNEANIGTFVDLTFKKGKFLINGALRSDMFLFEYVDKLDSVFSDRLVSKNILCPKLNIMYNISPRYQLFLKTGKSFHSNDTRVVVAENGKSILPKAYGSDLGLNMKPADRLLLSTTLWYLFLEQEFVYVGDAAVVEPSGRTQRLGVDISARYQMLSWLFADFDINYANPKSLDAPEGQNYVPLALTLSSMGGLSFKSNNGWNGSLRYRFVNDRPANEDNSIVAEGYTLFDASLFYTKTSYEIGCSIENILNVDWKETQFATLTILSTETNPVNEIHYIPGTPFAFKVKFSYFF